MELRCEHKLHGRVLDNGLIEVACQSRMCGKEAGNVILHRFDPLTGELLETLRFKKLPTQLIDKEEKAGC
jgi:hypothetical protein